jgi:hypothetical protein
LKRRRIEDFLNRNERVSAQSPRSGDTLCTKEDLSRLEDMLAKVLSRLEEIQLELSDLRGALKTIIDRRGASEGRSSRGFRRRSRLAEALREVKYILASESRSRLGMSPHTLRAEAAALGLKILDAGGDFAVLTKDGFEEFKALLSAIETPDPAEAAKEMGDYERLFQALRAGGQVYYDARRRMWRLLED